MELSSIYLVIISALLVGFSKTSIGGLGIIVVPLMASAFPAKQSTGVLLPMLILADIFAVVFYRRNCDWKVFRRIFPITALGVVMGYLAMGVIPNNPFQIAMGLLVMAMVFFEIFISPKLKRFKHSLIVAWIFGILAGFTTMIANAAGPLFAIYLLQLGLPKNSFVGTRAWFFLLLNCYKIPFSWSLGLISFSSLGLNLSMLPFILLGAFLGFRFLQKINMDVFKWIIRFAALASSLKLIFF